MTITYLERGVRWLSERTHPRAKGPADSTPNPYLMGTFAPVETESTAEDLVVKGHIPENLNGMLARIGPNPFTFPKKPSSYHWFLGDGMVHGVRIADGKALWYRSRWLATDPVTKARGQPKVAGPRKGIYQVVNTNVVGHGGRIWGLVEAGALPMELDSELNSLRHGLFDSEKVTAYSAHPHRDPNTGELHSISYDPLMPYRVIYQIIDQNCKLVKQVKIPVNFGPMIHDCAITKNHVLVLDLPVRLSFASALKGASLPYSWNTKHPARVGLLPRTGNAKDIRWYETDHCFVFHTCNAFEMKDGTVIVDVVVHDRVFATSFQGPDSTQTWFERWRLHPDSGRVQREKLSDLLQEFPRMDERLTTQFYRYAYTIGLSEKSDTTANHLYRLDTQTGDILKHSYGPHRLTEEAVFVPDPDRQEETAGWLMSYVYDWGRDTSSIVTLDAEDFEGEPVAEIELPVRVPRGFHCNWIEQIHS